MLLPKQAIILAREASKTLERLGDTLEHGHCLLELAAALHKDGQLDATKTTVLHTIDLLSGIKGAEYRVSNSHSTLAEMYFSRDEREKAHDRLKIALGIASSFNWGNELFWIHYILAELFLCTKFYVPLSCRL